MSKLAFTLIELILVVILIGLISFLVIKLPSFSSANHITILNLREFLYPNGKFYLFKNGKEVAVKDKNYTLNLNFQLPVIYIYNGSFFEKKYFENDIVFEYKVKNGIGDSFILENGNEFYVFKPFLIRKFNSLNKAKEFFLLNKYQPKIGEYY